MQNTTKQAGNFVQEFILGKEEWAKESSVVVILNRPWSRPLETDTQSLLAETKTARDLARKGRGHWPQVLRAYIGDANSPLGCGDEIRVRPAIIPANSRAMEVIRQLAGFHSNVRLSAGTAAVFSSEKQFVGAWGEVEEFLKENEVKDAKFRFEYIRSLYSERANPIIVSSTSEEESEEGA